MALLSKTILGVGVVSFVTLAVLGCEEQKSKQPANEETAKKEDKSPVLDPNLRKVLAASSASAQQPAEDPNGPPKTGVFAPGRADAMQAVGAPAHIEVGSFGAEPRVDIAPTVDAIPKALPFVVATRTGARSSLPTLDIVLGLKVEKPKNKPAEGEAPPPMMVKAKATKVSLSAQQPGQLPAGLDALVAKLADSTFSWTFGSPGGILDMGFERGKDAKPELEHVLVGVVETLQAAAVPSPGKPVGVGATWIARTRDVYGGVDAVSYRMYRVAGIEGDRLTIDVETKQYVASPTVKKAGLPEDAALVQFQSVGQGQVVLLRGHRLAEQGKMDHNMMVGIRPANTPADKLVPVILQTKTVMGAAKP